MGVRIAALAGGPIDKRRPRGKALLVCVVGNPDRVEGVLSTEIAVDGDDSTDRITRMIKGSRFREQVRVIALNGIAMAGLNVVDVARLDAALSTRTMIITRHRPRISLLMKSLRALGGRKADVREKARLLEAQKKSVPMDGFYVQSYLDKADTRHMLKASVELLRLSHLIASGVSTGESRGRI